MPYKRTYKPKTLRGKKPSPASKKTIKEEVKKELSKSVEVKISEIVKQQNMSLITYNTTTNQPGTIVNLSDVFDNIIVGPTQGRRIGNRITLKNLIFNILLRNPINNAGLETNLRVKLFFGYSRNSYEPPDSAEYLRMFQEGDDSISPQNTVMDTYNPINTDQFKIFKTKVFYLNKLATASSNARKPYTYYKFDLAKYMPKTIKFNDYDVNTTNTRLFMWMVAGDSDLGAPTDRYLITMDYSLYATFTDL